MHIASCTAKQQPQGGGAPANGVPEGGVVGAGATAAPRPPAPSAPAEPPRSPAPVSEDQQFRRPEWLPDGRAGPKQLDVPPERWAIRFSQFRRLTAHMRADPMYMYIKERKGFVNLYDLNQHALMPWTTESQCSIALLLNPQGLPAEFMLSHAWGEDIDELEQALELCIDHRCSENVDPAIWICWLALYQANAAFSNAAGPAVREQIETQPFEHVIGSESLRAMIAAHTTREDMYTRLWCPKELFEATRRQKPIWMASSRSYLEAMMATFKYWRDMTDTDEKAVMLWAQSGASSATKGMALAIDTQQAKCSSKEDEIRIRAEIECSDGKYVALNELILSLRSKQTLDHVKAQATLGHKRKWGVQGLKAAGFSVANLRLAGCISDIRGAGFSAMEALTEGCTTVEVRAAGFSASDLITLNISASDLRSAGFLAWQLKAAGFCALDLRLAGYSASDMKTEGFDQKELASAGFAAAALKEAGVGACYLREACYSAADLIWAGFSVTELKSASFTAAELKNAGLGARNLREAGYSATDVAMADFSATELKSASFTAAELKEAGLGARNLREAGYSAADLITKLREAGYARHLIT